MTVPFGIDLGTTRTSVAMVAPNEPQKGWYGNPQVINLADGPATPSAILFESDTHVVGNAAKNMGHRHADCAQIFKREMSNGEYHFVPKSRGGLEEFSAEDLSSLMLEHVHLQAKRLTGLDSHEAVITVPAYFGEPERRRTRTAAERAGLTVLDIINEPTAAIISYLFQPGVDALDESVLVFDLGGGTFDTVVVKVAGDNIRVVAIDGDLLLGGRDFDQTVSTNLADRFELAYPDATLPTADESRKARLLLDIEMARESLSSVDLANIPVWGGGDSAGSSLNVALTKTEYDAIVDSLVERCIDISKSALASAKTAGVVPSRILFVGGMTKTPRIRQRVTEELGLFELTIGADPDHMVAKGAAIWAQKIVLHKKLSDLLGEEPRSDLELDSDELRGTLRTINADTAYPMHTLHRLLKLQLRSISSRGYALRVIRRSTSSPYLDYLLPNGAELPFEGEPGNYAWCQDMTAWALSLYEDSEENRHTENPDDARLVEIVKGPMSKSWPEGSSIRVKFSMGLDQILHVQGWQVDGDGADELRVSLAPGTVQ